MSANFFVMDFILFPRFAVSFERADDFFKALYPLLMATHISHLSIHLGGASPKYSASCACLHLFKHIKILH